ncbi:hypothetical protein PtA15_11A162 [Puccinia triticina]|uniref:Uncharacterized protein n=1 Tax=Puccinia triticina TaxID=208348 RepID=A0ABY7CYP9_9BASI|nr:uncharacterized protein PtA15_11A162 [Puccinia triticina]WAQ89473.1 hypothetical protein PtA15_11A162 [Puccinia triticina]
MRWSSSSRSVLSARTTTRSTSSLPGISPCSLSSSPSPSIAKATSPPAASGQVHRQLLLSKRAVRNHFFSTHSSAAASCPPSFSNPPCPSSSSQQHQQHDINLPAAATAGPLSHTFVPHNPLDQVIKKLHSWLFKNPSPSAAMFIMGAPSLRSKNNNSDEGSGGGQWQRPGQAAGPELPHRQPCLLPHWHCLYLPLINHFCCRG